MTKKEKIKFLTLISNSLPGTERTASLVYFPVQNGMLTGCAVETSSFDGSVILINYFSTVIAYPLYEISFDLSKRLRTAHNGDRWDIHDQKIESNMTDAIDSQALPFLSAMNSPLFFGKTMAQTTNHIQGVRAAAIAFALAGDEDQTRRLITRLDSMLDLNVPWQADIQKTIANLMVEMASGSHQNLLSRWEKESCQRLKLKCSLH